MCLRGAFTNYSHTCTTLVFFFIRSELVDQILARQLIGDASFLKPEKNLNQDERILYSLRKISYLAYRSFHMI